jgi:hypothetical protein
MATAPAVAGGKQQGMIVSVRLPTCWRNGMFLAFI